MRKCSRDFMEEMKNKIKMNWYQEPPAGVSEDSVLSSAMLRLLLQRLSIVPCFYF